MKATKVVEGSQGGQTIRLLALTACLALICSSCDSYLSWQHGGIKVAAEAVFEAALAGDTSMLANVTNAEVRERLMIIRRDEPALLSAAAERLRFIAASVESDTAVAHFLVSVDDTSDEFALRLIRRDGNWRVVSLTVPSRI